jgi:hypothetical protein
LLPIRATTRKKMKKLVIASMFILGGCVVLVSACTTTPQVDTSKKEPICSRACSAGYVECARSFSLAPITQQNICVRSLDACVGACPDKGEGIGGAPAKQSTEDKLKELKRLRDAGLISNEVYLEQQKAILGRP